MNGVSRRRFVLTQLSAGFAAAVQPVTAETIVTGMEGLSAGPVQIPVPEGEIPGYRALPAKAENPPIVLVVQEIFGVHEHIKDICRRLAKEGYLAVAPQLFARQGDVSRLQSVDDIVSKVVSQVPDKQVMSDLDAAAAWARTFGGDASRLAITGFCWGGRITWLYAAHNPSLKAGAAWYGRLNGPVSDLTPRHPIDVAASLKAPVLGLYGAKDQSIPIEPVEKMRAALSAAGSQSEIQVYPNAGHGFNADYRPGFQPADAKDAWKRMLAWFRRNGV